MNPEDTSVRKNGIGPPRLAPAVISHPGESDFPADAGASITGFIDCRHPGCSNRFMPSRPGAKYCGEHDTPEAAAFRDAGMVRTPASQRPVPRQASQRTEARPMPKKPPQRGCQHPDCEEQFTPTGPNHRYCAAHSTPYWNSWRGDRKRRATGGSRESGQARRKKPAKTFDERTCRHEGCSAKFVPERKNAWYCPAHRTKTAMNQRAKAKADAVTPEPPPTAPPTTAKTFRDLRVGGPRKPTVPSALDTQVGGDHYKSMAIQPVVFAEANKLTACEFAVIKYVCRHRVKGGREDLRKARHFLEILEETTYGAEVAA